MSKIDLLIFITAKVVEPGVISPEDQARLQQQYKEFMRERLTKKGDRRHSGRQTGGPEAALPAAGDPLGNKGVVYQKP